VTHIHYKLVSIMIKRIVTRSCIRRTNLFCRGISAHSPKSGIVLPRPTPSPAFNPIPLTEEAKKPLYPLSKSHQLEYDDSFVGLSGGQIFHEMMLRQGVKHIFGYPGGAILPVFDAIYNSKHFDFILPRHEQGAGHMAEGYARASGKPELYW